MKKGRTKVRSTILFILTLVVIVAFAYAGGRGVEVAGWEFKSFNKASNV